MDTDRRRLLTAGALRATGTSMLGVLLGIYLAESGFDAGEIGLVSTAGLSGAVVAAIAVTWKGDRWGRRRSLIALCAVAGLASAAFLAAETLWILGATLKITYDVLLYFAFRRVRPPEEQA